MPESGECQVCCAVTQQKCSGCQTMYYCSKEHQKQHWKQHKNICSPARVKEDQRIGRYLEATRNIKSGDIIIKEKPLITGPAQVTPPVCLGCYRLIEEGESVPCDKCGWAFCSVTCTKNEVHAPECFFTQQRGEKVTITNYGSPHPNYQCITVLRCLYQRDHDPKLWTKLQALESHEEDRKNTDKWNNDRKMIVNFIWEFFKLKQMFREDEIMRCCGIVQINGHEVPLTEPEYVAVFDRVSMAEHSCRANCNKSFMSDGRIEKLFVSRHRTLTELPAINWMLAYDHDPYNLGKLEISAYFGDLERRVQPPGYPTQKAALSAKILCAGVNIPAGSHVTVCYTDPLWGTEARRHHLAESKFFECTCERCSDVTELETMFSAVKCKKKNCKGHLLPETFLVPILHKTKSPDLTTRGLDNKTWKCGRCGDVVSDAIIQQLLQDIGREISIMPKNDPNACERFINHCSGYLHPHHSYMTDVSVALAQMVGQQDTSGLAGVADDRLLVKVQLCKNITSLLEILAPAETRLRGSLLFELHAGVAESGRRKSLTEGPFVMLGYVTEARKILREAAVLLANEPPELPEGHLAYQAKANLIQIDELIKTLSAALPSPL